MYRNRKLTAIYIVGILSLIQIFLIPISKSGAPIPEIEKNELYVAFFNLPDGEATLVKSENDQTVLINTGSGKSEESLLIQLEELNVSSIDTLILTNQTIDYCGNAKRLIERYTINSAIYTGELTSPCMEQVNETKLLKWSSNKQQKFGEHLEFRVLTAQTNGEMSLGITFGKTSIMYLSSSNIDDEEQLINSTFKPEILKVGDYAKGNSPSSELLNKTDPHLGIVFHCEKCVTNEGLIERMSESWIDVYQLEQVGTTIIRANLQNYEILS
ncbi:MBL fold metallo-hydrolase [Aquibacillus saliphilus]|uniref:MBL fold metallo-hydrolase n=1 Tax=Aquibacillus saliphilus TaxID=1909422 RepID=UPI001CF081E2|nr:MBL fold metallo-hydrolase [Aquibacillus saliphilus]